MDSKVDLQPAFVLHQRPYRESSLLLEVFAVEVGRVGLIAKGARRPRSPYRARLGLFKALLLSWRGRGELGVLTGAEPDGPALLVPPAAIASGLYVNELLVRMLHRHDPHPELFVQYRLTLEALAEAGRPLEQTLRVFEKRLLEAVGYGLTLDREAGSGAALQAEQEYRYVTDYGPVAAGSGGAGVRVRGATLLALAAEGTLSVPALKEAKSLMRTVINAHLEGRPLWSRAIFPPRVRAAPREDCDTAG